jgi:hypothetical protein
VTEIEILKKQNELMFSVLTEYAKLNNWECSSGGLFGDKWTRDYNGYDLARSTLERIRGMQRIVDRCKNLCIENL